MFLFLSWRSYRTGLSHLPLSLGPFSGEAWQKFSTAQGCREPVLVLSQPLCSFQCANNSWCLRNTNVVCMFHCYEVNIQVSGHSFSSCLGCRLSPENRWVPVTPDVDNSKITLIPNILRYRDIPKKNLLQWCVTRSAGSNTGHFGQFSQVWYLRICKRTYRISGISSSAMPRSNLKFCMFSVTDSGNLSWISHVWNCILNLKTRKYWLSGLTGTHLSNTSGCHCKRQMEGLNSLVFCRIRHCHKINSFNVWATGQCHWMSFQ